MLGLSNTAGYAILALGCLEEGNGTWVLSKDIAARTGIPPMYLSKVLNGLTKSDLVSAKRGYRGGFKLSRSLSKISLLEIVEAAEGRRWSPQCLLGLAECSDERGCPAHSFWKTTRMRIEAKLRKLTLAEVAAFERTFGAENAQMRAANRVTLGTQRSGVKPADRGKRQPAKTGRRSAVKRRRPSK